MKIISIEDLHCDAGWRTFSFLKITTDEGISGWSEYNESYGDGGLTTIIRRMAERLIGLDPRPIERIDAILTSMTRLVQGGMSQRAIGAIGNALLDVKARSLGVPVYEMFGGPVRDRLKLYWSHCGGYRLEHADTMGVEPVRSLDDLALLGAEVARCGFSALKTNVFDLNRADPKMWSPGFAAGNGWPEVNIDGEVIEWAREQLAAFRSGAGPEVDLMLDLAWNGTLEGFTRMARALEQFELLWLEMDTNDATGLANVRVSAPMPIASCETMYGQARCQPFLQARAVDTMIIDVPWNGLLESLKIAHMAGVSGSTSHPTTCMVTFPR